MRRMKAIFCGTLLGAAGLSASAPAATIVLSENFESYNVTPTGSSGSNIGSPWSTTGYLSSQRLSVISDSSPFASSGGNRALQFWDNATGGSPFGRRSISVAADTEVVIAFDFKSYGNPNPDNAATSQFQVMFDNGQWAQMVGLILRLDDGGSMKVVQGGGTTTTLQTINRNSWYHVVLTLQPANSSTDRYSLSVQEHNSTTGLQPAVIYNNGGAGYTFRNNVTAFNSVQFGNNSPGSTDHYVIDNLLVTVPEPASATAFGVAALALLQRRRPGTTRSVGGARTL